MAYTTATNIRVVGISAAILFFLIPLIAYSQQPEAQFVQSAEGTNSVQLNTQPQPGNLLVAVTVKRTAASAPVIDGEGWILRVDVQAGIGGQTRRSLAIWTKVASDSEPSIVSSDWDNNTEMIVKEFSMPEGYTLELAGISTANTGFFQSTSLNTGSVALAEEAAYFLIAGLAAPRATDTVSWDLSGVPQTTISGNPSASFAFGMEEGPGLGNATASYPIANYASVGLVAFLLQSPPDPDQTSITADPSSIPANGSTESVITVQARDSDGDILAYGGADVELSASLGSLGPVTDHNNGRYTASLTGVEAGIAIVSGTLNGEPIQDIAEVLLTAAPTAAQIVQVAYGTDQGASDEAVFDQPPQEGHLLVAVSSHRFNLGNPQMSGSDWILHVNEHYPDNNETDFRRGLAMFTKFAGASENTTFSVDWNWDDPSRASNLIMMEVSVPDGWVLEPALSASNHNGSTPTTTLSTGSVATQQGETYLLISGLGARENAGVIQWDERIMESFWSLYLDDGQWPVSTSVGFGMIVAEENAFTVATMSQASLANAGLVVFQLRDNSGFLEHTRIFAQPLAVPADGEAQSEIVVRVLDQNDDPVSGSTVLLTQGDGSSTITPGSAYTNAQGEAYFAVVNAVNEEVTYSALVDGVSVNASVIVRFTDRFPLSELAFREIGGEIYVIHSFDEPGAYELTIPEGIEEAEVLIVGGGGSGGTSLSFVDAGSGGGGAGGVIHRTINVESGSVYLVEAGLGGLAPLEDNTIGQNGGNSRFGDLVALGGGGGIGGGPETGDGFGNDGGSGGGSRGDPGGMALQPESEWNGIGNRGGNSGGAITGSPAGGGGGAGAPGGDVAGEVGEQGGDGGDGLELSITGMSVYYAGGGGGGTAQDRNAPGEGGLGGGGNGANDLIPATSGVDGLGGGGGGGNNSQPGANGGGGVVIVTYRYQDMATVAAGEPYTLQGEYRSIIAEAPVLLQIEHHEQLRVRDLIRLSEGSELRLASGLETDHLFEQDTPDIEIQNQAKMILSEGAYLDMEVFSGTIITEDEGRLVLNHGSAYRNRTDRNPLLEIKRVLNGDRGWRMMSSPLPVSYAEYASGSLVTQGVDGSDYPGLQPNIIWWDEEEAGTTQEGWKAPASVNDIILPGAGFFYYVFDGAGLPENHPDSYGDELPLEISVSGYESATGSSAYHFGVSYTPRDIDGQNLSEEPAWRDIAEGLDEGWNLLGNPTASALDWDNRSAWQTQQMDDVVYVWDPESDAYLVRNGNQTGSLEGGRIAPFQSFWVRANSQDPEMAFTPQAKSLNPSHFYGKQQPIAEVPRIKLMLKSEDMETATYFDFSDNASPGLDANDAILLEPPSNTFLQFYSVVTDKDMPLVINHLPARSEKPYRIPLGVRGYKEGQPVTGEYQVWLHPSTSLPDDWTIYLKDHVKDTKINLRQEVVHQTRIEAFKGQQSNRNARLLPIEDVFVVISRPPDPEDGDGSGKRNSYDDIDFPFTLIIEAGALHEGEAPLEPYLQQNYPNPFNSSTMIRFGVPEDMDVTLELFDIMGRRVRVLVNERKNAGMYTIPVDARQLASGVYLYRLTYGGQVKIRKMTLIR